MKNISVFLSALVALLFSVAETSAQITPPYYNPANVAITGGNINGTVIGGSTAAAGSFTTLSATDVGGYGTLNLNGGSGGYIALQLAGVEKGNVYANSNGITYTAASGLEHEWWIGATRTVELSPTAFTLGIGVNLVTPRLFAGGANTNWPIGTIGSSAGRHIFNGADPIVVLWNENAASMNNESWLAVGAKTGLGATTIGGAYLRGGTVNATDGSGYLRTYISDSSAVLSLVSTATQTALTLAPNVNLVMSGSTVAGLPAGVIGMRSYVTDALAPAFGAAVVGGGAVVIPVFYNGAAWIVG